MAELGALERVPANSTDAPLPYAELIYRNWYLFEKLYRSALLHASLAPNVIDFCVTVRSVHE